MGEAQGEAGVHVVGRSHALADRERSLVHQLADDPAEHEAGGVGHPLRVEAQPSEEALGGLGGGRGGGGEAGELGEPRVRDRREQMEAHGIRLAAGGQRAVGADGEHRHVHLEWRVGGHAGVHQERGAGARE